MRANAPKILVFLTILATLATPVTALAKPRKRPVPAASPASHTHSPASRKSGKSNKLKGKQNNAPTNRVHSKRENSRPASRHAAASAPEPAPPTQPEIHVIHDRKQHHGTPPTASFTSKAHRSTSADPVPVISVIRPTATRPQLPSIEDEVIAPAILPTLYDTRGHLVMPPPLKGSHEILLHQNQMAEQDGLVRVQDDDDLIRMRATHMLVPIPVSDAMVSDYRLPANRRFVRPWAAQFLVTLGQAHHAYFHTPLQVNSAVRTVAFQQKLMHTNGNAAPAEGETASPHLTGQAVDIAKRGLSAAEIAWMRGYLLPLVQDGRIDVEEEFQQACFHISIYKNNFVSEPPYRTLPTTHRSSESAMSLAIGSDY